MKKIVPLLLLFVLASFIGVHHLQGQGTTTVVGLGGLPSGFSSSGNGNQIFAPNGSAASPAYSFTSSTNTGAFLSGGNYELSVGGAAALICGGVQNCTFGTVTLSTVSTNANCTSSASPAVCAGAPAGSVVIAAAATTVQVNTTAVTANSQIFIQEDDSLGTKLSVTCNTTSLGATKISARSSATSFTITTATAPTTNPSCLSYWIVN